MQVDPDSSHWSWLRKTRTRYLIQRWLMNGPGRLHDLQKNRRYWLWRRRRRDIGRRIDRARSRLKASLRFTYIHQIALLVVLTVSILLVLERLAFRHLTGGPLYVLHEAIADFVPGSVGGINSESVGNITQVHLQVAGVFVALYIAAVSLVLSSYTKHPSAIRQFVIDNLFLSGYSKLLTYYAAYSGVLFLLATLQIEVLLFNVLWVNGVGLAVILSFVPQSVKKFGLFDPLPVSYHLLSRAFKILKRTERTPGKLNQSTSANIVRMLDDLSSLSRLVMDSSPGRVQYASRLVEQLCNLVLLGGSAKSRLGDESSWHLQLPTFSDLTAISHDELRLMLWTGYNANTRYSPDYLWLEKTVNRIIVDLISDIAKESDLQPTVGAVSKLSRTAEVQASWGLVDESVFTLNTQISLLRSGFLPNLDVTESLIGDPRRALICLDLLTVTAFGSISAMLQARNMIERVNENLLADTATYVRSRANEGSGRTSLHPPSPLPRAIAEEAGRLVGQLRVEKRVEGQIQTPDWFVVQRLAIGWLTFVNEVADRFVGHLEETDLLISGYEKDGQPLYALHLLHRSFEEIEKAKLLVEQVISTNDLLYELSGGQTLPVQKVDADMLKTSISKSEMKRIVAYGKISVSDSVPTLEPGVLPDYVGDAYVRQADACVEALLSSDLELFRVLFPTTVMLGLNIFQRKLRSSNLAEHAYIGPLTDALHDLATLSGLAILIGELSDDPLIDFVEATWKRLFDSVGVERADGLLALLHAAILTDHRWEPSGPRALVRTTWQMQTEAMLRSEGYLAEYFGTQPRKSREHESALVRAYCVNGKPYVDLGGLFAATYLMDKKAIPTDKWPRIFVGFRNRLDELRGSE